MKIKYLITPILCLILFLCLAASSLAETTSSGQLTDTASYVIDNGSTLTVTGTGATPDYTTELLPAFGEYASSITAITIDQGITELGDHLFLNCNVTSVTVPDSVTRIGQCALGFTYRDDEYQKRELFTIYGADNSAAEAYAEEHGFSFVSTTPKNPKGTCGDDITWELSADGVLTIRGTGKIADATNRTPSYAEYATEKDGFVITSIVIEEGITAIGASAFSELFNVTAVSLPKTLTTIGDSAFRTCTSLASLSLHEGITTVGTSAFEMTGITKIVLPATLTSLGEKAFYACHSLTEADISSLKTIPIKAFAACETLKNVTFGRSLTKIETSAFEGCVSLERLSLPDTLVTISDRAFHSCTALKSIYLPKTAVDLGTYIFRDCKDLASVTFGDSATTIPEGTFYGCSSLTSVVLGASIQAIGDYAFVDCTSLSSILIPSKVKTIGLYAIGYVGSSSSLMKNPEMTVEIQGYLPSVAQNYANDHSLTFTSLGYAHNDSGTLTNTAEWSINTATGVLTISGRGVLPDYPSFESAPWAVYKDFIKAVSFSNGIQNVGSSSFEGCSNLTLLSLPSSVTFIGSYAFAETSLATLTLPSGLREIDTGAFKGCSSLYSINLPSSLETIGQDAFRGPNTTSSIYIPSNVTYIGTYAIGFRADGTPVPSFVVKGARGTLAEHYATQSGLQFIENGYINVHDENGTDAYLSIPGASASDYKFFYKLSSMTLEPSILLANTQTVFVCNLSLADDEGHPLALQGTATIAIPLPAEVIAKGDTVVKNLRIYLMSDDGIITELAPLTVPSSDKPLTFTHSTLGTYVITDADLTNLCTITVEYKDESGAAVMPQQIVRATIGAIYRFEAPTVEEMVSDSRRFEGRVDGNMTLTFTYSPKPLETTPVTTAPPQENKGSGTGTRFLLIILLILLFIALLAAVFLLVYLRKKKKKEVQETEKTMAAAKRQKSIDKFEKTIIVPDFKTQEIDIQSLFADEPEEDTEAEKLLKKNKKQGKDNSENRS